MGLEKLVELIGNGLDKVDLSKIPDALRKIKPDTWAKLGLGAAGGVALGTLIRQPEINKEKATNKRTQDENARLQALIVSYNEQFVEQKRKLEALKVYQFISHMKEYGNMISCLTYQYGAREYIILLDGPKRWGKLKIPREATDFFNAFQKVVDGKDVSKTEGDAIKNYIYSKYKKEIESLQECDFHEVMNV